MKKHKIAVIGGDGIGPEVTEQGVRLLKRVAENDGGFEFEFRDFPWGGGYYLTDGVAMPENGLELLREYDAILLGAIGDKRAPDNIVLRQLLLKIRREFDEYVNVRPIKLLRGAPCPLKDARRENIDMVVIRENSEGEYYGAGERLYPGTEREVVLQTSVFSRFGCERIIRYAFEFARRTHKSVTSVSKGNALNYSMVFWDEIFSRISAEYPEVEAKSCLVDAACMFFVKEPERFEIVVTSNLFGDIITDLGAAISGGMGLATGANINPERKYPSMFEPIHGSAPDIAGKNIANPLATFWSCAQLLEFFGYEKHAARVLEAMETVMTERKYLTPDMGGSSSTSRVADAVIECLK